MAVMDARRSTYNIQREAGIDKCRLVHYSHPMMMKYSVIVVTGASERIGRAIAVKAASLGSAVVVHCYTDVGNASETVSLIERNGGNACMVQADLRTLAGVEKLAAATLERFGRWDALVNAASTFLSANIEEVDESRWDADQALHVKAPFFLSRSLYRHRKGLGSPTPACVVNVTDTQVRNPTASRPSYYCAKSALEDQVRVLGKSLAPLVRVNAVAPGAILPASSADEHYFKRLEAQIPLGKLARSDDVVDAIIFLLENDSITGQTIVVDGGEHLRYIQ